MTQKLGKSLFYKLLRISIGIAAAMIILFSNAAWILALLGDTSLAFDFVDVKSSGELDSIQIVGVFVCALLVSFAMGLLFLSSNRFLKMAEHDQFFADKAETAVRQIGISMIAIHIASFFIDGIMGWLLTHKLPPAKQIGFDWFPFDIDIIILLAGVTLVALARALSDARRIEEDLKQII